MTLSFGTVYHTLFNISTLYSSNANSLWVEREGETSFYTLTEGRTEVWIAEVADVLSVFGIFIFSVTNISGGKTDIT